MQNSGFAKVAKVERNKQPNKGTNSHTRDHDKKYFICCILLFVCFFDYGKKSKLVEKKERVELNKGLNYVQRILKQQKQNQKTYF